MKQIVLLALTEKSPRLLRQLTESGQLQSFLEERTDQIDEEIVTSMMEIANHQGAQREPDPLLKAGILRQAQSLATERVLGGELLEFPPDATCAQDQVETVRSSPLSPRAGNEAAFKMAGRELMAISDRLDDLKALDSRAWAAARSKGLPIPEMSDAAKKEVAELEARFSDLCESRRRMI